MNGILAAQYNHSNFDGNKTVGYAGLEYQGNGWNTRATVDTGLNVHTYVDKPVTDRASVTAGVTYDHNRRDAMVMVGLRVELDGLNNNTVSTPKTHMRQRMDQIGFNDPRMARPSVRDERYTHVQNHSTTTQTVQPTFDLYPESNRITYH